MGAANGRAVCIRRVKMEDFRLLVVDPENCVVVVAHIQDLDLLAATIARSAGLHRTYFPMPPFQFHELSSTQADAIDAPSNNRAGVDQTAGGLPVRSVLGPAVGALGKC
jgi:hypothetical protein